MPAKDGLYSFEGKHFTAGFVLKDGKVVRCAPILRKYTNCVPCLVSRSVWVAP